MRPTHKVTPTEVFALWAPPLRLFKREASLWYDGVRQMKVPFSPSLIPAGLAGAILIAAKLLALSPWIACGTGLMTFTVLAPLLDRTLLSELALIVKALVSNPGPASPPAPTAV